MFSLQTVLYRQMHSLSLSLPLFLGLELNDNYDVY